MQKIMVLSVLVVLLAACVPTPDVALNATNDSVPLVPAPVSAPASANASLAPAQSANESDVPAKQEPVKPALTPAVPAPQPAKIAEVMTPEGKLPTKVVKEGEFVSFPNLKATDPDGKPVTYSFTAPLDAKGKWQTKRGDVGAYKIVVTASNGKNSVKQDIIIIVLENNSAPSIELADVTVNAGDLVKLQPKVTDPDNDPVKVSYSGWMTTDSRQTTLKDVGTYSVTVTALDGRAQTFKTITVKVNKLNRAPKIDALPSVIKVKEGEKVTLLVTAKDPDGDKITYSFTAPLDSQGVWQTKKGDAGSYKVNVTASDGELKDLATGFIVVEDFNAAPVLTLEKESITVNEGEKVMIKYNASDTDGDKVSVVFSGWMTGAEYVTSYNDQGSHTVTVTADDGKLKTSKNVTVTVYDVNRPPVFDPGSFS